MKKIIFPFIILFSLFLIGCSTADRNRNVPFWYYEPQNRINSYEVAFVGEGHASTERQALLLAYSNLNSKVYAYLGMEEKEESYRELSVKGTIKDYNLIVRERFDAKSEEGFSVFLLGVAEKALIDSNRSNDMLKEAEIVQKAKKIILEGDELVKTNYDIAAVKKYLSSMVLTYPLKQIENEFSFSSILDEVLYIISSTKMTVIDADPESAKCNIAVKRISTTIPSKVFNGFVRASYSAVDSFNRSYVDSFTLSTGDNGIIQFEPRNHVFKRKGTIDFTFDIYDELAAIEKLDVEAANKIREALEKTKVSLDYDIKYISDQIGVCVFAFGIDEDDIYSYEIRNLILDKFEKDGADAIACIAAYSNSDEEIISDFKEQNSDAEYMLIIRIGAIDTVYSKTGIFAVPSEGNAKLYNIRTDKLEYDSGLALSNGFGDDEHEASRNSFENFALQIYSHLKDYYV